MILAKLSIRRRVTLTMIYLIAIGFGIFSLTQLKVAMTPDLDMPMVIIVTSYSGVSPEDIENLLTRPVEEAVSATENIKAVTSESSDGSSLVMLEFAWGTDMDQAEIDVRNNLDSIRDQLPDDADEPRVFAFNPSLMPIMYLSMDSPNLGPADLRRLADDKVESLLERIEGVATVTVIGGLERQINVKLDAMELAAREISAESVASALATSGGLAPAGRVETPNRNYNLRVYSEYRSLDQIENVVVANRSSAPVRVKDVAMVEDGHEELSSDVRINNGQGVAFIIQKQSDANTVQTVENIRQGLPEIQAALPEGTGFSIIFDNAQFIERAMSNLSTTAVLALLLASAVIYFFLRNWRGSLIMAFSMPISIVLTFGVLMVAGLTLNIISMAGLALAVGMLVDNSIVVLENIFRHREMGEDPEGAADLGTGEVGTAITTSTLTTIAVFFPVLFVPGMTGQLFKDMVLTVTFSLAVSLMVALTLVPMLSSRLPRHTNANPGARPAGRASALGRGVGRLLDGLAGRYRMWLGWSLHHKRWVLIAVAALFAGSIMLFPFLGGQFMPLTDQGQIRMNITCATGLPLDSIRRIVLQCEKIVEEEVPERESALFQFGSQEMFGSGANTIEAIIKLSPTEERDRSQFEIQDRLRARLDAVPGITYSFQSGTMGMSSGSDIEVQVIGHDLEESLSLCKEIQRRMKTVPGLVDVEIDAQESAPQLEVHLDSDILNDLGLTHIEVANVVSTAIQGKTAAHYHESGDEYGIYVQMDEKYREDRDALADLLVPLPAGGTVPVKQLGEVRESLAPQTIFRENQERYISVGCNLSGTDLSSATAGIREMLSQIAIPSDVTVLIGGSAEDQQEANFYLVVAMLVAIALVFMIMASQFESYIDPLIIMATVPLSIIGVVFSLFLTGTSLSVMSLIGVVMLVGIVVNNGIVLVDYINRLRDKGEALYVAAEDGGVTRMRPVLMTALTTIFAMVPLALEIGSGSETWAPLARAVIGGLVMSTALTLIVIPVLYVVFEEWGEKIRQRLFRAPDPT